MFADDVSAVIRAVGEEEVIRRARILVTASTDAPQAIGFKPSRAKCENFLVRILGVTMGVYNRGCCATRRMRAKEKIRHTATLRRKQSEGAKLMEAKWELPFSDSESFRLLGVQLGDMWAFRGHLTEARGKLRFRRAVLNKVFRANWGLGNHILTTTARALIGSLLNYGLMVTGSAAAEDDL